MRNSYFVLNDNKIVYAINCNFNVGKNILKFLDPADNTDKKVVCPDPNIPAASSLFNITYRDYPMCPGGVANYSCKAGGLNAFKVLKFVTTFLLL